MVEPADLQSAAIAARRLTCMAERTEFEADTRRVEVAILGFWNQYGTTAQKSINDL